MRSTLYTRKSRQLIDVLSKRCYSFTSELSRAHWSLHKRCGRPPPKPDSSPPGQPQPKGGVGASQAVNRSKTTNLILSTLKRPDLFGALPTATSWIPKMEIMQLSICAGPLFKPRSIPVGRFQCDRSGLKVFVSSVTGSGEDE